MKQYYRYLRYLLRHKWEVFKYCCQFGYPWRGLLHDLSRFRPSEFIAHARYFYGKGSKKELDRAWMQHLHRNPHHIHYWTVLNEYGEHTFIDMPIQYRYEMLADWYSRAGSRLKAMKWYYSRRFIIPKELSDWIKENL